MFGQLEKNSTLNDSLLNDKISDWSKLKASADENFNITITM